ncbi:phosphatidylinositol-glycan biosynthesis class X protein-like [Myzus persicae]|uniref:phosphatidylinositol-glycan biosynthesis class X protein-like n=1 Tax=Myzus persicae TaxID=13164 RepID=UPI000B932B47|nr:phosphatidylinositol-glycan biosynthesis class X protein-like [Myzus persicae]
MGFSMKTKIILFALYSLIFVTSVVSYYGFKGSQDSMHYLAIHSGNINLQVKNEGYHRVLHTTITADYETSNRKDCAVTLRYDFPADIYVDKYELATIALNRKVEFYVDNKFIDVETPAHKSDPFVLYVVNYTLPDTANKLTETEFPIHLRYQKAAEDSRYKEVRFGDAYSDVQMLYLCKGPRNSNWKQFPLNSGEWIPASYVKVNKDVVMYVPVGDTNNLPWVSLITHGSVLLGTYYILRRLMATPSPDNAIIKLSPVKC